MRKFISICVCILFVGVVFAENYGNFYEVEFVRAYDGDTIYVNISNIPPLFGDGIPVRLAGIDTPEIRGKCAREKKLAQKAKNFVVNILANAKQINLINVDRGKYFRIIADVQVDGVSISQALLDNNLAYPYDGTIKKRSWC